MSPFRETMLKKFVSGYRTNYPLGEFVLIKQHIKGILLKAQINQFYNTRPKQNNGSFLTDRISA